jgi:dTDP-4-amino-4,6-dideoxygalactose transaminase
MRVPFLDLTRQVSTLREQLERAIGEVLDRSRFVESEPLATFENVFAAFCGAEHAVGVASGTDAIEIALRAAGIGHGDEVITAANTCVPTVAGIEAAGAVPVLVDADEGTYTLDPAGLASALTERTRAIVPVHLYGQCADMEPIVAFAREHGLRVIEDAAQAHGAEYAGRRAGTLGDVAAFSFYPTKNLGALGDAGAVVTSDPEIAERARLLRSYGARKGHPSQFAGGNSRLDSVQAAVLLTKLPFLAVWNERRRRIAAMYHEALSGTALSLPAEAAGRRHVYHLFVVRVPEREAFQAAVWKAGIETLVHYPWAIHEQPAYARLRRPGLEVSEALCREVVSLPLYPELTDTEAEAVAAAVVTAVS